MKSSIVRVLMFCSLLATHAVAEGRPPAEAVEKPMREALQQMNLSPEQKLKIREIRLSTDDRLKKLRDNLEKARVDLDRLLGDQADDDLLTSSYIRLQSAKRVLELERFQKVLAIRAVLTEDQRMSFQSMRSKAVSASAMSRPKAQESSRE